MLPHSTVAGIHFVAAVAAACKSPDVVGTVVAGAVELVPSGMRYAPAVGVGIAAAVVVGFFAAAFVGAIVAWDISVSGAVVAVAARCVVLLYCFSCGYDVDHDGYNCPTNCQKHVHLPQVKRDKAHMYEGAFMKAQHKTLPDGTGAGQGRIMTK